MKKIVLLVCLMLLSRTVFAAGYGEPGTAQYQLASGDMVQITVFGQDDLSMKIRLPDVGTINYPYLGEMKVVGLSVQELETQIFSGLQGDYLVNPSVSVSILEYRPFFIDGEVKRPGGYPFQPGLSIDKAAALAGGYTERASKTEIFIVREVNGAAVRIATNSTETLKPGDIVNIKQTFF